MEFIRTEIPDVVVCTPKVLKDERGRFMETFRKDLLDDFLDYEVNFCQDNESKSVFGVLRGLHFQKAPHAQAKLIRVVSGKIQDIAVDIRRNSAYFGKHISVELNAENKKQLFIPRGFAHGFIVLSKTATIAYKCDNYYHPASDSGIAYNDPALNIDWQLDPDEFILSEKDKNLKFLSQEFP